MVYLINVSIALFAGLMMTRLLKVLHLNFPDVTAFLLAGLAIGPYGIGRLGLSGIGFHSMEEVNAMGVITSAALGCIAFSIGNEFRLSQLRATGRQAVVIGIFEATCATIVVDIVLISLHFIFGDDVITLPAAITLGAIAAATAPAATLMVVRQYKAHGKVTELLLPIVALDDAIGLIIFAVSYGIAQALKSGNVDLVSIIVEPLLQIAASLVFGALLGALFAKIETLFYSNTNRLNLTIIFVLLSVALSSLRIPLGPVTLSFSSLLVCMMVGTIFCNLCPRSGDIMERSNGWTAPLFALFFILSGAELELGVFKSGAVVCIGLIYIVFRCVGKFSGAGIGSILMKCDPVVKKYLGITLFPQAGVDLGGRGTTKTMPGDGPLIRNIVLFGVFVYELLGPMMTRWALTRSGDIVEASADKKSHDRFNTPKDVLHWRNTVARLKAHSAVVAKRGPESR
jgi:Kef-type K+ transport system membrane component KefB